MVSFSLSSQELKLFLSSLSYQNLQQKRTKFKNFLRMQQKADPIAEDRIMTNKVEKMNYKLQKLEQTE